MTKQSYIITLKPECSDVEVQKIKDGIKGKGGTIEHEYSLIKGFSFTLPKDDSHINTLSTHPNVENVEHDQEVRTQ